MAYNYGAPHGAYGQPPGGYGQPGGGAPGMSTAPPPGTMQSQSPGGLPGQFQPPPNMPNFDMNAPIIRLGVQNPTAPADRGRHEGRGSNAEPLGGGRYRAGLGAERGGGGGGGGGNDRNLDRERAAVRESMLALQPPTREEVARTIFVGGLGEGAPDDEAVETALRCAGKLRRWTRARDADGKKCKFGFAEYEDVESLEAANEIFQDVEVPLFKNRGLAKDEHGEVKRAKLLVVIDEQSKSYIEEWKGRRKENDDARQFRIDGCKEDLRQFLTSLTRVEANGAIENVSGDSRMTDGANGKIEEGEATEVVTIPISLDDDLSDIPVEMRPTVAAEIKSFRDRSNRRDLERLRREEEMEQAERQRSRGARVNRLASPGATASSSNGVPVGPRGVQGAPSGPKAYRGAQLPSDYANGVAFVGEHGANGAVVDPSEDSGDESDETLERQRRELRDRGKEDRYREAERKLRNRERARHGAQERERNREEDEKRTKDHRKESAAQRLREWDDRRESELLKHEYYNDRSSWLRKRTTMREREAREDEKDRTAEERENAEERRKAAEARGMADSFLDQTANEIANSAMQKPAAGMGSFKISLGSAAAKSRAAAESVPGRRRIAPDVEGLLEDEEDAAASGQKRPQLKPLTDLSTAPMRTLDLTEDERVEARKALAAEIPTDSEELFARPVQWGYLSDETLNTQVRPFVEKKVVEYLGVQEDLLVDAVMDGIKARKEAKELVGELEVALEDESELLVKKVWRLLVFWSEYEARGLNA